MDHHKPSAPSRDHRGGLRKEKKRRDQDLNMGSISGRAKTFS